MLLINGHVHNCNVNYKTKEDIATILNLSTSEFYVLSNGKKVDEVSNLQSCHVVLRLLGGKGGFGSMLRAIGAQIEKTTNREACRDLSGRRLRDINEEKRLKAWITQQAEREREVEDRKKKKLERLCQKPKHEFRDDNYEKERSELTDRVEDALKHGLSMDKGKRKSSETITTKDKKKKPRLWLGSDEELSTSEDEDDNLTSKPSTSKIDSSQKVVEINDSPENLNTSEKVFTNLSQTKEYEEINDIDSKESLLKENTDDVQVDAKEN